MPVCYVLPLTKISIVTRGFSLSVVSFAEFVLIHKIRKCKEVVLIDKKILICVFNLGYFVNGREENS